MKKRGLTLAIAGTVLGLLIGLTIRAIAGRLEREVLTLLDEIVRETCQCQVAVDGIDIHLIRGLAVARGPRIIEGGKERLRFDRIEASISLARIRERIITIRELRLRNGFADGVGDQSVVFRLLDNLTTPIPPERDRPDRWRVRLDRVSLRGGALREDFGETILNGDGIAMSMKRNAEDNFTMQAQIDALKLSSRDGPFVLGTVRGSTIFREGVTEFPSIQISRDGSVVGVTARSFNREQSRVEGDVTYDLRTSSFNLPDWISLRLLGSGDLSGRLANPQVSAPISFDRENPLQLNLSPETMVRLDQPDGTFSFELGRGPPRLVVPKLSMIGPAASFSLSKPLQIRGNSVQASGSGATDLLQLGSWTLRGVKIGIDLSGALERPILNTRVKVDALSAYGVSMPPLECSADYRFDLANLRCVGNDARGTVTVTGSISDLAADSLKPALKLYGSVQGLAMNTLLGVDVPFTDQVTVSGDLTIGGRAEPQQLDLDIGLSAERDKISVASGALHIRRGALDAQAQTSDGKLSVRLKRVIKPDQPIALGVTFDQPKLGAFDPRLECIATRGSFDYQFHPDHRDLGSGKIELGDLRVGCGQYSVRLAAPISSVIRDGVMTISKAQIVDESGSSKLTVDGTLGFSQGYNLSADGPFMVETLLPFAPSIDNLSGSIATNLNLRGSVTAPRVSGTARLNDVSVESESLNFAIGGLKGELSLDEHVVNFGSLTGSFNGGTVTLRGRIVPLDFASSSLGITFEGIGIEPEQFLSLVLSGEIQLARGSGQRPEVRGVIHIDSAELRRNLDMRALFEVIAQRALTPRATERTTGSLPDIDLNIRVHGEREIILLTNWASAELRADANIEGSLAQPSVRGGLSVINGYLALKDSRFDVTSGTITFQPPTLDPQVQILAETYVRSPQGDYVLVFLEAGGSLRDIKMTLSSESGLSEREIVRLLTSAASTARSNRVNTLQLDTLYGSLRDDERARQRSLASRVLSSLTQLDSLTIEPQYEFQTAAIVPVIVATKRLSERVQLFSETTFAGNTSESNVGILGRLLPNLTLSAAIDTFTSGRTNAAQIDATYTILSRVNSTLEVTTRGVDEVGHYRLLRELRLSDTTRVSPQQASRIREDVERIYREAGFYEPKASVSCAPGEEICKRLEIVVTSGPRRYISRVIIEGDSLATALPAAEKRFDVRGEPATQSLLDSSVNDLTGDLRSEGYLAARVRGEYVESDDPQATEIRLSISLGRPVSFKFIGAKAFSATELLETINIRGRRQPFGNNTIKILLQNIERLYLDSGYLYVAMKASRENLATGRVVYTIAIEEGQQVRVDEVVFSGDDEIVERLNRLDRTVARKIREPRYAITREIEEAVATLTVLLVEDGFPNASVSHEVVSAGKADRVTLRYRIDRGTSDVASAVQFTGLPDDVDAPVLGPAIRSIPTINRTVATLNQSLHDAGYHQALIEVDFDDTSRIATVKITPGAQQRIDSISIEGIDRTSAARVQQMISLRAGQAWNTAALEDQRRRLLRLGLFSRVDLSDGLAAAGDAKRNLIIKLEERPLQSLELGAGVNSENGLHLFGEATDRGLFADGRTFSARLDTFIDEASGEINQGFAALRYSDPHLLDEPFRFSEDVRFQRLNIDYQEFDLDRVSATTSVYRSGVDDTTVGFGHTILQEDLQNVSPGARIGPNDSGVVDLSFIWATLTLDRRDDLLNPRSGYVTSTELRLASAAIGSDASYAIASSRFSWLAPQEWLDDSFSLATNTTIGGAWGFGSTDQIPITQRFYTGGRTTIRGFRENSLGPTGSDGSVIGGDALFGQNLELRYLLNSTISMHGFFDAGTVFLRDRGISAGDIRRSSGVGMRLLSPIGPVGFDVGFPLDEQPGEPSVRFHFTIGTIF